MEPREELRTTIFNAIAESSYMTPETLKPEHSLLELGIDSLVIASIVATVENAVQYKFDPDELVSLFEAESVASFVDKLLGLTTLPHRRLHSPLC
jgi:acyl carrier protein